MQCKGLQHAQSAKIMQLFCVIIGAGRYDRMINRSASYAATTVAYYFLLPRRLAADRQVQHTCGQSQG
jgi:hypothetical protein